VVTRGNFVVGDVFFIVIVVVVTHVQQARSQRLGSGHSRIGNTICCWGVCGAAFTVDSGLGS